MADQVQKPLAVRIREALDPLLDELAMLVASSRNHNPQAVAKAKVSLRRVCRLVIESGIEWRLPHLWLEDGYVIAWWENGKKRLEFTIGPDGCLGFKSWGHLADETEEIIPATPDEIFKAYRWLIGA